MAGNEMRGELLNEEYIDEADEAYIQADIEDRKEWLPLVDADEPTTIQIDALSSWLRMGYGDNAAAAATLCCGGVIKRGWQQRVNRSQPRLHRRWSDQSLGCPENLRALNLQ